jgi:hypothetical protein
VKILGLHFRNTNNIGDRTCHPLDYFDFTNGGRNQITCSDIRGFPFIEQLDVIVFGGGALGSLSQRIRQIYPNATFVGWGIGCTSRDLLPVDPNAHNQASKGFSLWGGRDWLASPDYVPCVSCMSPIFDENFGIKNDAVVYGHSGVRPLKEEATKLGLPYLDNTTPTSLREALEFLASGKTVITSSYHGAYWATLLGRRVAMLPFGTKFFSLKHRPPIADDIASGLRIATEFDGVLNECREINQTFAQRVQILLDESGK